MIDKTIHIPIYDCSLRVILCRRKDYGDTVRNAGYDGDVPDSAAVTLRYPNEPAHHAIVFMKKMVTPKLIAHETAHLVNNIFTHLGIGHSPDNDEHFAYLLGYLAGEIHKIVNDHGNKD